MEQDELSTTFNGVELSGRQRLVLHHVVKRIEMDDGEKMWQTTVKEDSVTTGEVKRACDAIDWSKQLIRDLRQLHSAGLVVNVLDEVRWDNRGAAKEPKCIALNVSVELAIEAAITPDEYWAVHRPEPEDLDEAIEQIDALRERVDELEEELNQAKAVKNSALENAKKMREKAEEMAERNKEMEERLKEMETKLYQMDEKIENPGLVADEFTFGDD
ncbi:hypothetical protein [Haloarcula marina]|uniref:hypothetical protein n=1 Tax=Haloarcula marina TaxID=2961574 RepID=UPI0020B81C5E|nr:hypothetical protein [Halomicroarcula marina]